MNPNNFPLDIFGGDNVFTTKTRAYGVHINGDKNMCLTLTTLPDVPLLYLSLDSTFDALNQAHALYPEVSLTYSLYNFDELTNLGCSSVLVDNQPWTIEC